MEPTPLHGKQSLSHWTAREVPTDSSKGPGVEIRMWVQVVGEEGCHQDRGQRAQSNAHLLFPPPHVNFPHHLQCQVGSLVGPHGWALPLDRMYHCRCALGKYLWN